MPFQEVQRRVGVKIPEGQLADLSDLPSLTVVHLLPMEMMAIQYVTTNGKMVTGMLVKAGDDFYLAPQGDNWLNGLKPLSDKMLVNVKDKWAQAHHVVDPTDVPTEDDVDIIASDMVEEPLPQPD